MSELLQQLLSLLHEEELIRLRHRAKKRDMKELSDLLGKALQGHKAKK